jgi:hypothetical protein
MLQSLVCAESVRPCPSSAGCKEGLEDGRNSDDFRDFCHGDKRFMVF